MSTQHVLTTSYEQDIALLRADGRRRWYLCLAIFLLVAPWILPDYWLEQLAFVFIYSIISVGLMLLTGYTGQFSIGHAAFMGVGAYTEAYLVSMGWPLPLSLAAAMFLSAGVGVMVGLPALRVRGIYLAIATLSFAIIVEEVMARWQSVTGGGSGRTVSSPGFLGWTFSSSMSLYFLCLVCLVGSTLIVMNLLRAPTGRAFVAIRDSEISAQSMGIAVVRYKLISFAISAALAGLGGALYAHKIKYLSPDQFGVVQSIDLLMMVIIGGLGSLHGAFFGAIFLIGLPQLISLAKDYLPTAIGQTAGLQGFVYGIVLIGFVMLEPQGLYGRWLKIRTWLQLYPFYRRGMLSRQRVFQRSERLK